MEGAAAVEVGDSHARRKESVQREFGQSISEEQVAIAADDFGSAAEEETAG